MSCNTVYSSLRHWKLGCTPPSLTKQCWNSQKHYTKTLNKELKCALLENTVWSFLEISGSSWLLYNKISKILFCKEKCNTNIEDFLNGSLQMWLTNSSLTTCQGNGQADETWLQHRWIKETKSVRYFGYSTMKMTACKRLDKKNSDVCFSCGESSFEVEVAQLDLKVGFHTSVLLPTKKINTCQDQELIKSFLETRTCKLKNRKHTNIANTWDYSKTRYCSIAAEDAILNCSEI